MSEEFAVAIGKIAELHGRASEINRRIQQDAQVLIAVQQELSATLSGLGELWEPVPAPIAPPPMGPRVLRIVKVFEADWTLPLVSLADGERWAVSAARAALSRAVGWLDAEVGEWLKSREATAAQGGLKPRRRQT